MGGGGGNARGGGAGAPPKPERAAGGEGPAAHMSDALAAAAAGAERPTWGLVETLDIMADADLMKQIAESEDDRLAGRVVSWEDFLKELDIEDKGERPGGGARRRA